MPSSVSRTSPPGRVRSIGADGICVATGSGWLWLQAATRVCGEPIDLAQWAGSHGVHGGGLCTVSDPDRFFSYRRDKVTGRMAALVWRDA